MPTIIKESSAGSPGIITFTGGEALYGLPTVSKKVRKFLESETSCGRWLFGVHIQGDFTNLGIWPNEPWHSFILWPNPEENYLSNVIEKVIPYSCINFLPQDLGVAPRGISEYDMCLVTRASEVKNIEISVRIIKQMLNLRPQFQCVVIVPDYRENISGKIKSSSSEIFYFQQLTKMFTSRELKNISFISSSTHSFGKFPLSASFVSNVIKDSKFLMLNSHSEGTPRVLAEALLLGTPCIVSENLSSGINHCLNKNNSIAISDVPDIAAQQIDAALENYDELFQLDREDAQRKFSQFYNLEQFKDNLSGMLKSKGFQTNGRWFLESLHLRLACHGEKVNYQFFNDERLFFDWFSKIKIMNSLNQELDEDFLYGQVQPMDRNRIKSPSKNLKFLKNRILRKRLILKTTSPKSEK